MTARHPLFSLLIVGLLWCSVSCEGDRGPAGVSPGPDIPAPGRDDDLPGVVVSIQRVLGASGVDGSFQVGDRLAVEFRLATADGRELNPANMTRGSIMVSGPTFNYQRVLAAQSDLFEILFEIQPGVWRYTFAAPIPATYLQPLNYTGRFPIGVLAGEDLLTGTYTVGIEAGKDYVIEGETFRDVGNAHLDFRFGGAAAVVNRAVVANTNCNVCHSAIQAHGGNRTEVTNCLLCHTAGAEDRNDPSVAAGTPDVSIDFKVMIHKIHAGSSLPSVNGVSAKPGGELDYAVTPRPYRIVGYGNSVHDYSSVGFGVWPSQYTGMPRDSGYAGLGAAEQAQERAMLAGPVACAKCHGDPDGAGAATAPRQGDLIYRQPTRVACGSCHDDWIWDRPYTANMQTMPAQTSDATCIFCHQESGSGLAVRDAHQHPLLDPSLARGIHLAVSSVSESGAHNGSGAVDPGEKVRVVFSIRDDAGQDLSPALLSRVRMLIGGPTANPNLLYNQAIPTAALGVGPTYDINLPQQFHREFVGASTASNGDSFSTARTPHWNVSGAETSVWVRTGTATGSTLLSAAPAGQNYLDLASSGGSNFTRDDVIVVDSGVSGKEEYLTVQFVDGDRLWFSSPHTDSYQAALSISHNSSASVAPVTLSAKTVGVDYSLNTSAGTITELVEFGNGNQVLVQYTSDYLVPTSYPGSPNDSPDLDSASGKWRGLSLVDGSYHLAVAGRISHSVLRFGQSTSYSEGLQSPGMDFLIGSAVVNAAPRVDAASCVRCHDELQFHGGNYRGYTTCMACHGVAGAEDRPRYVAGNAPATTGLSVEFRTMLHKIHHGKELANAASYQVIGFGSAAAPNNFTAHSYATVGFPDLPGGSKNCVACHGVGNLAFLAPAPRTHPQGQPKSSRVWRDACMSCHDNVPTVAHIDANTSPSGVESCSICHSATQEWAVKRMHKVR